jgi:hypothetical protein
MRTRIVHITNGFEFLGYKIRKGKGQTAAETHPGIPLGTTGIKMRANVGITSRLQNGESNIPPTITQANGC